ncbi:hypothetical protein KC644_04415 [Candidatus Berkelbacteria bacterium]|nr:hypothetical protein [Candidatus Berkelbacteria bacterium]
MSNKGHKKPKQKVPHKDGYVDRPNPKKEYDKFKSTEDYLDPKDLDPQD